MVVVTSFSIQKIHSLVVVEDLVVVEVVVVVEDVVGAGVEGVTGVPVVVSNKNSSRSTALSVTSSNSIVLSSVVSSSIISISELFSDEFVIRVVEIVVWDLGEMDFEVVIGTNSPITIVGCISVKVLKSVCVFVCFMLKIIIST